MYISRPPTDWGSPALGIAARNAPSAAGPIRATQSSIDLGPTEQLAPTTPAPAAASSEATFSGDSPDWVSPSSLNVISATIGASRSSPRIAAIAASISTSVGIVSITNASTPASSSASACSAKISRRSAAS